ncbi:hydroxylase [Rubrivivax gelatinosus]|nr:hydroxylase [Rubrivivax gelatinosus]
MNPGRQAALERIAYEGPPEWREPVFEALARVVDPEIALSIVDVGLVYGLRLQDRVASVLLTTTSAACPLADSIADDVETELMQLLPAGWAVDLELTWEPEWTPERMSADARRFMGW